MPADLAARVEGLVQDMRRRNARTVAGPSWRSAIATRRDRCLLGCHEVLNTTPNAGVSFSVFEVGENTHGEALRRRVIVVGGRVDAVATGYRFLLP